MAKAIARALWLCAPDRVTDPLRDSASRSGAQGRRSDPDECRAIHRVCCSPIRTRPGRHTAREVHNCSSRSQVTQLSRLSKVLKMATETTHRVAN